MSTSSSASPPTTNQSSSTVVLADAGIVEQVLTGKTQAFRHLVERYQGLVYGHSYRMSRNRELAEDVTQETFLRAFRSLKKFDGRGSFKSWLMRIATNCTLTALEKQKKQPSLEELGLDPGQVSEPSQPSSPLSDMASQELVEKALLLLEPNHRQVVLLRYHHDLTYDEIASTLETPVNTVRTWLHRAKGKLKSIMDPWVQGEQGEESSEKT